MEEPSLAFPPFRLDPLNAQLWRGNERLPLRPKPFALLHYLVAHAGRLVSQDELRKAVWPDTAVSEGVLKGYIRDLRSLLGDDPKTPRFIETIARRGYRFIAPLAAAAPVASAGVPASQTMPVANSPYPSAPVVGRDTELAQLHAWFAKACQGQRQLVFMTGEPGIGKTTLVEAFLSRAAASAAVRIGRGQCVEHYGAGEAYLPLLEALSRLCREEDGQHLMALLHQYAPTWLVHMPALLSDAELEALQRRASLATPHRMVREFAEWVEALAQDRPLVLALEDLQWCDHATLDVLSMVAQRREPARLLIVSTYRPAEVIVSDHPLKAVKQELHARRSCAELALGFLPEAAVRQYLTVLWQDSELPRALAPLLHQLTEGNPLFLVTVVEDLIARGIVQQHAGWWQLQGTPEQIAGGIPDSVRQLIEKQIERLPPEEQRVLAVASVAGMEFAAAAVAAGVEAEVERVEAWCEGIARQRTLLRAMGAETWPDGTLTGRYTFVHALHRSIVVERVPPTQRIRLHRRIAERLVEGYGAHAGDLAVELASHFAQSRDYPRAVQYRRQAGDTALRRHAPQDALDHFTAAVDLLARIPELSHQRSHALDLQLARAGLLMTLQGYAALEVAQAYQQARALCARLGSPPLPLFHSLWGLFVVHFMRAELTQAAALGAELCALAPALHDPALFTEAHLALGVTAYHQGQFPRTREEVAQGADLVNTVGDAAPLVHLGQDPWVAGLCYEAFALAPLGYVEQAHQRLQQALQRAQVLADPFSLVFCHEFCCHIARWRGDFQTVATHAEAMLTVATTHGFRQRIATGLICRGWALAHDQQRPEGLAQIREGIAAYRATGAVLVQPLFLSFLAEAAILGREVAEGMQAITEALELVQRTEERCYEAELYRLKGILMLQASGQPPRARGRTHRQGDGRATALPPPASLRASAPQAEAEACFLHAIDIARRQHAKLWELRATVSLARLWRQQGKRNAATTALTALYSWFTEGFTAHDLQEAKALLEECT